ncbi:MAG: hypothetical protein V3V08_00935 [Nannocystaceae bacterium]
MSKDSDRRKVSDPVVRDAIDLLKKKLKSAIAPSPFADLERTGLELFDAVRRERLEDEGAGARRAHRAAMSPTNELGSISSEPMESSRSAATHGVVAFVELWGECSAHPRCRRRTI